MAHLARLSLDLRGVRASPEELAVVRTNPGAIPDFVSAWLAEPAFAEQMAWRYNQRLHTAVALRATPRSFPMSEAEHRAMGWAPLAHVQQVLAQDRPFSEVVTAQALPQHPDQAAALGWPHSGEAWATAVPPDGRPMAGILSSPTLWLVIDGDATSMNRQRANAVARVFLCADFLDREGSFEFSIAPEELQESESAAATDPACQSCHAALDPLAALFGGFSERSVNQPLAQAALYSTFTEDWFRSWTEPAYYGAPIGDFSELGPAIAQDPRFDRCTTQFLAESLLGRPLEAEDPLVDWHQGYLDQDRQLRAFVADFVETADYRSPQGRTLSNEQLYFVALDLAERLGGGDLSEVLSPLLWSPERRVLAGGSDDFAVLEPNTTPSLGHHLSMAWVARELALAVSLAGPANERQVREQIAWLHGLILSHPVEPESAEVDALWQLYQDAGAWDTPELAWDTVLQALIRHPQALVY